MLLPFCLSAATNDLTGALQRGLFEEEANRNLDAAAQAYQAVSAQFDKDRKLAATAIFRLGEVYRKQGRTNEAVAQYERIMREFAEEQTLATLSRQNLAGLRQSSATVSEVSIPGGPDNASAEAIRLSAQLAGIEQLKDDPEKQARAVLALFPDEDLKAMLLQLPRLRQQEERMRSNPTNDVAFAYVVSGKDGGFQATVVERGLSVAEARTRSQLSLITQRVDFILSNQKARLEVLQAVAARSPTSSSLTRAARLEQKRLIEEEIKSVEQDLADIKRRVETGRATAADVRAQEREVLKLRQQLAALADEQMEEPVQESVALASAVAAAEREVESSAATVQKLKALPVKDLRAAVQQNFPNPVLTDLLKQLTQAEQNLAVLKRDYASEHPEVLRATALADTVSKQIADQVEGIMKGLELKLEAAKETAVKLRTQLAKSRVSPTKPSFPSDAAPFTDDEEKEIRRIQEMIKNSPDLINAPAAEDRVTPLCRAARDGQLRVATFLLDHGAAIDKSSVGRPPLHFAAEGGHKTMVELLVQRGADVNVKESRLGNSALHVAASKGFLAVVEALLAGKADVNGRNASGVTPLQTATLHPLVAGLLVEKGANIDAQDDSGTSALIAAATQLETLRKLIAAHATLNLKDKNGGTALFYAANNGPVECVRALLDAGADPNVVSPENDGGATPLHVAAGRGDRESVKLLLEHGAKPNVTAVFGQPGVTPLMLAASQKDADLVAALLKYKADPNLVDSRGGTALLNAVWHSSPEVVRTLLAAGANPDTRGGSGVPVLVSAIADVQSKEIAAALIEAKADVNAPNANGWTPLHWAAQRNLKDFVELLINAGADVNLRDKNGTTPLDLAKSQQRQPQPLPPVGSSRLVNRSVGARPPTKAESSDIATLLRQHGALDDLPNFNRIEVSRASSGYRATVFTGNTNGWSRYTLIELLAQQFGLVSVQTHNPWPKSRGNRRDLWGNNSLRFPDFDRITIQRPGRDGKSRNAIPVNLSGLAKTNGAAVDVPLQFGDVVEVPEADHPVSEMWSGPVFPDLQALTNIVSRRVTLIVGDKSMELVLAPRILEAGMRASDGLRIEPDYSLEAASFMLRSVLDQTKLVRSSSDLTRVKVTRTDSSDGNPRTWIVDCSDGKQMPDLWLRDGDMVEVPDRSESISAMIKRVVVVGEVRTPGTIDIPANENFTAAKAILKSGGFTDFANKKKIKVIRKGKDGNSTIEVNMVEILEHGKLEQDIELQADDIVTVPKRNINF